MHLSKKLACCLVMASGLIVATANARLPDDTIGSTTLSPSDDHRTYIVDFQFDNLVIGKVVVVDPHEQKFLGMMPTGGGAPMVLSHDRETVYTADFFYSRYVRGERVDILTAWDSRNLEPKWELELPAGKRAFILTERYGFDKSADDKFLYIYNFTPSTSITVVDVTKQEVVNEIAINGCILNYPAGDRQFASLCGDGALQTITLDDDGKEIDRTRTKFFDPDEEKLVERATQVGDMYYFVTTLGEVVPMDMSGTIPAIQPRWSLVTEEEREQGWAPGGWQLMAASPALNRLYVLMHPDHQPLNWEDPSQIIWVFDLDTGKKIGTLDSPGLIWSLSATSDDNPLLLGMNIEGGMEIFDLVKGEHTATMDGLSSTPTLVINH